jgi:hypothetical protein
MSNIYFTPARALQALIAEADYDRVKEALSAVVAELPDDLTSTDDLSSRKLVDLIFTTLLEGAE